MYAIFHRATVPKPFPTGKDGEAAATAPGARPVQRPQRLCLEPPSSGTEDERAGRLPLLLRGKAWLVIQQWRVSAQTRSLAHMLPFPIADISLERLDACMSVIAPSYFLHDPRPTAKNSPYTFFLPDQAEIENVGKGDLVRLAFDYLHETKDWAAERMWVIVHQIGEDEILGALENHPAEPTSPLKAGDAIAFKRFHILDIEWAKPEDTPPPPLYRTYWERCLVDQCVLDGEEPVENLYREQPEPLPQGDTYPDSGWRILGRRGELTDAEMDVREVSYVALGAVLNVDDSWLAWIDAPVGTYLSRDFETNTYSEIEWTP